MTDSTNIEPPDATSLPQFVSAELAQLLAPLTRIAHDDGELDALLRTLGAVLSDEQRSGVLGSIATISGLVLQLQDLASRPDASFEAVTRILALGQQAFDTVRALDTLVQSSPELVGFGREVAERLFGDYLSTAHPLLRSLAVLTTVIEDGAELQPRTAVIRNGLVVRQPFTLDRFHFDRIARLLSDPLELLRTAYGTSIASAAAATVLAEKLFPRLQSLAYELGCNARASTIVADSGATAPAPSLTIHVSDVLLGATADAGITVILSPAELGNLGLVVVPFGTLDLTRTFGAWQFALALSAGTNTFAYGPQGLVVVDAASQTTVGAIASAALPPADDGPRFVLGSPTGTRLEIGSAVFNAAASFTADHHSLSFDASAMKSAFVIAASDGDGFLAQILPADGLRAEFDLGLGWSNDRGFALHGSASLEADLSVVASVAGLTLSGVHVGLRAANDRVDTEISTSFSLSLGPVYARIDRVGVQGTLGFPANGGNFGPVDVSLRFKPPTGVGLSLDAGGALSGGGVLLYDPAQGVYAGAMQLSLREQLTLTGFGLIATRLPDGARGYSLLVFITAENFRPVPLGLGFMLLGIGGMVGVHRTFDLQALRQGLKSGTLANLLFPRDPIANAPALIQAISQSFPARPGSYLLGLLAKIGWLTPTLVLLELALILESGARNRLLALGRIRALLPSADNDLVHLDMESLGVIDFDAGTVALDAVLVDSRLVHKFAITGAAALRASFGSTAGSNFLLAVGGLNPRFAPPAGLPALERVAIALCAGSNPRLLCEAYFAITANTIQFGARAWLYASAAGFSVEGDLGFDVLIHRAPLHFIADYRCRLQLKAGSHNLFMVEVSGELEGPRPLRVAGRARFRILFCHFTVRFDATLVRGEPPPAPPSVNVLALLKEALAAPSSWNTERASSAIHGVALRSLPPPDPGAPLVLDPLGRIAVKQQVVPLNTRRDIELFGSAPVAGERRFMLSASLGGSPLSTQSLQAEFAPAQYFNLSDDEKLAAPSFESMDAGCLFGDAEVHAGEVLAAPIQYRTISIAGPAQGVSQARAALSANTVAISVAPEPYTLTVAQLQSLCATGAAARAPARRAGRARFRLTDPVPAATFNSTQWTIVPRAEGDAAVLDPLLRTWSEHQAALKTLNRARATWQLVPSFEIEG